jgi:Ca2+-binding EF-hand superfamily protein
MNTKLTYRGGLALGLLAFTLLNPTPRLLAQACQDMDKSAKVLKRFDANGNGQIDPEEQKAADQARQELFQRLHGKYDVDGNGQLSDTEKAARRADLQAKRNEALAKFDKDGDGRLSREERVSAMAARKADRKQVHDKKSGV